MIKQAGIVLKLTSQNRPMDVLYFQSMMGINETEFLMIVKELINQGIANTCIIEKNGTKKSYIWGTGLKCVGHVEYEELYPEVLEW